MPHLIHHVMGHVAVKRPIAGRVCNEFDVARLSDPDQHRRFRPLRRKRNITAIGCRDPEVITMDVYRVMIHRAQVAQSDANSIPGLANERRRRGKYFAVDREHVEVVHL